MNLLEEEYTGQGNDDVQIGGAPSAQVLNCRIEDLQQLRTKDGKSAYIQLTLGYKSDDGKDRLIRFQNFNPKKSESGRQLWTNLLIVAGATSGLQLKGKHVKVVCRPEEYIKDDQGTIGTTLKPWPNGYFSKDGLSASEKSQEKTEAVRINEVLQEAIEAGILKIEAPPQQQAKKISAPTDDDMPF